MTLIGLMITDEDWHTDDTDWTDKHARLQT